MGTANETAIQPTRPNTSMGSERNSVNSKIVLTLPQATVQ